MGWLWVEDRGFFEFPGEDNPIWHKVIRSPVFISDDVRPELQYAWTRPYETFQSSDGSYWFTAPVGIVHLSPESGEWCLFTTEESPVVEDENRNLWIVAFGKLYRLTLH